MSEQFNFLKSNRFWALVLGAVILYLHTKALIGKEEVILFETILAGFVGIRTIDRAAEKSGAVDTGAVISAPTPSKVEVPSDQGVVKPE